VHGVLNTDNINISGESFDYGPWRFVPTYDPEFTAAYFDHNGLYAYGRRPDTLLWNLVRLAECLLPLSDKAALETALQAFAPQFHRALDLAVLRRLGLGSTSEEQDAALAAHWWAFLDASRMGFERAFFDWHGGLGSARRADAGPAGEHYAQPAFAPVRAALAGYAPAPGVKLGHPYFMGPHPCTMLVEEVEAIRAPIAERDDWSLVAAKLEAIGAMADVYGTLI